MKLCIKCNWFWEDEDIWYSWDSTYRPPEKLHMCKQCHEKDELKKELQTETEDPGEVQHAGTFKYRTGQRQNIICPYCGTVEEPDWECREHWEGELGEWVEMTCWECEKQYELEVVVSWERTTRKIIEAEEVEEEYERRRDASDAEE